MIDPNVSAHYIGDCRELLKQLPDKCVQTCITSPPFWGLRDYDHEGQIGLEDTPEEYVQVLVEVFSEVHRVLRDDGTLWLNLGDCYVTNPRGPNSAASSTLTGSSDSDRRQKRWAAAGRKGRAHPNNRTVDPKVKGRSHKTMASRGLQSKLKHKDLVGIPWSVAFALREAGWYLRMDNIWSKPNPTPESVGDRPTKSHEYMFLFSKRPSYYYDGDAIAEPIVCGDHFRNVTDDVASAMPGAPAHRGLRKQYKSGNKTRKQRAENGGARDRATNQTFGVPWQNEDDKRNKRSVWTVPGVVDLELAVEQARLWAELVEMLQGRRDKPSVWTVVPIPYRGAHFATFPPQLIEPCVLACSRPGDLVLDPFFGSGTTGEVAEKHERRWIGFDIQPKYADLARERTAQRSLPLARGAV
jgi:DNA modification methylase